MVRAIERVSCWFLPFSVFYQSIAVGCELSLHLETRTYLSQRAAKSIGFSTPAVAKTLLGPHTLSVRNVGRRALNFWCMPIAPFVFSGQPQGLLASME